MSNPAHLPPPPDGDATRVPTLLAVSIPFNALAIVTTIARISARSTTKKASWDDLMIGLAVVLLIVQIAVTAVACQAGFGRHEYYLTVAQISEALKYNYIAEVLLFLVIPFTKISICFFVLRIRNSGWLKWLVYGVIAGLVITTIVPFIVLLAGCRPISAFWEKGKGECWNPLVLIDVNYIQVGYSIFSDLVCSALPIFILWNVQMRPRFKLAICGLMSLGLLATACAIIRMSLFVEDLDADLTWNRSLISIWCGLEQSIAIICANLALSGYIWKFFIQQGWSKKYATPTSQRYYITPPQASHWNGPTQASNIHKTTEFSIMGSYARDSDVLNEEEVKRQEWV